MTSLTGPSYKMAVLLELLHQYPERPITGTDYVASFGMHNDYPGYTPRTGAPLSPLTGCHKTEQSHAELGMADEEPTKRGKDRRGVRGHHRLNLPIPITAEIGLGDAIKRVTSAVGIPPCGGCQRRAEALNRWLVISGRRIGGTRVVRGLVTWGKAKLLIR